MASYKKVLELYRSGLNNSQIGERVGYDRATVQGNHLKERREGNPPVPVGGIG